MKPFAHEDMPLVMLGAGGHAKVLRSLIDVSGRKLLGVCDPNLVHAGTSLWRGVKVLGGDEVLDGLDISSVGLVNGVGQLVGKDLRQRIYDKARALGFVFPPLIHPSAWVDESVELSDGVQIMAGAIVQPDVRIGANSTINTRASLDHDCTIASQVHIAPGVVLCGGVTVAHGSYVGSGATVTPGVVVGEHAVIGAGTVVVRDVPPRSVIKGPSVYPRPLREG